MRELEKAPVQCEVLKTAQPHKSACFGLDVHMHGVRGV